MAARGGRAAGRGAVLSLRGVPRARRQAGREWDGGGAGFGGAGVAEALKVPFSFPKTNIDAQHKDNALELSLPR